MREYWIPAMLSSELPLPDSDPVRVMLLGERLIGFRDSSGNVSLIQNLCPHRGASLFFARNEKEGIRCVYHGWKFDHTGQCVDMPNEPPDSNFKARIKAVSYPCVERAGVVWTYMGPREEPPPLPDFEVLGLEDGEWDCGAVMRECNWLQALEGDLDTSHVNFLHSGSDTPEDLEFGSERYYMTLHKDPKYVSLDTDFGAMYGAYRPADEGRTYWRIAQFLFPFHAHIPADRHVHTRSWVPMDDNHTMFFLMQKKPQDARRQNTGKRFIMTPESRLEPENGTGWFDRFRLLANADNDYLIDRDEQRSNWSFTGIAGTIAQDQAVTEAMDPILDRTIEHLGTSDAMVIRTRHRIIDAVRAFADHKVEPPGVDDPEVFRTRSCSVFLPNDADWLEATKELRLQA